MALLANIKVALVGDDMILWLHDSKKKLTIKSFYREVCKGSSIIDFPADAMLGKIQALKFINPKCKVHCSVLGVLSAGSCDLSTGINQGGSS